MDSGTKRDQVILGMQISLDGYAARPDGSLDWVFSHFRPDLLEAVIANLSRLDTVVIGRRNYQEQASHWPNESGPIADIMNSVEKVVFSKTLRPEDL
ncbi:MAG TPA: dihydrofolate reductase family protein, partial [Acidimicrobiia bacterium]|nr:dihydrofolate reductase family protein [Acidimicrobiia bacterium]